MINLDKFDGYSNAEIYESDPLQPSFLDHVLKTVIKKPILDRNKDLAFHFRTLYYMEISESLNIPFVPDLTRLPTIGSYHAGVQQQIWTQIQSKFDNNNQKKLERVMNVIGRWPVPLPSIVTNFLIRYTDKSKSEMDPGDIIEEMRHEFSEGRKNLRSLEKAIVQIDDIGLDNALKEIKSAYSNIDLTQQDQNMTGMILSIIPTIAKGIDPSAIIDAIKQGKDIGNYLKAHKQMSIFIRQEEEASNIINQKDRLRKAFDNYLTSEEKQNFLVLNKLMEKWTLPLSQR